MNIRELAAGAMNGKICFLLECVSGVNICDIRLCVLPPLCVFAICKHKVVPKSRLTELALIVQGSANENLSDGSNSLVTIPERQKYYLVLIFVFKKHNF